MPGLRDLPDEVILRLHAVAEEALYTRNRDRDGSSAVCWAAANGNIATLDKAWKHRLNVNEDSQVIPRVSSPLVNAVKHGQDSAVICLLDHGADIAQEVRARNNCRRVAHQGSRTSFLHIAMCLRHVSTAHLLITRGAPLEYPAAEFSWPDLETTDALIEACTHGLDTVVKVLVKDYGMDPQTRCGSACRNVLVCAARDNRNVSTIKTLVALGVNVDGDRRNWTQSPLHAALGMGNFDIAHTLLDLGANIFPYEYCPKIDTEGDGGISSEPIQVQVAPLHDTIATIGSSAINRTNTQSTPPVAPGETAERWQAQRAAFMQRLIELGTDIDAKVVGGWADDRWEDTSPLGVASAIGEVKAGEVADLIALGAKVDTRMLQYAYAHLYSHQEESLKKIKLLLRHGARVDEPMEERGMSLLQLAIEDANENRTTANLHEILLMCSPKNLHSHHLDQGLEECLLNFHCDTSSVLVRHGARVSCRDKRYLIAGAIVEQLKSETGQVDDLQDIEADAYMSYRDIAARDCMSIIMDMGLSIADQCLVFPAVLRKRKVALTHLFLDRGLAGTAEAFASSNGSGNMHMKP
ncbi:hypothetical protein Daus18300_009036 [Diaporthe australafricana]|uniref:Ankyrin repeat protein n=1 Tax=Diaporthe australafricana TaxID=127596 RepID=A0ABR3WG57_9PEZI